MRLYSFFRSSASYRVRIGLNLKGLTTDYVPINLRKGDGEQYETGYRTVNAQALVPSLEDGPRVLTQSLAILEYLDETHPTPPLLPRTPGERARVRSLALAVACEIHPVNNTRVVAYLKNKLGLSQEAQDEWYRHWIVTGLTALETRLSTEPETGRFCHGDTPGLADCVLIPQLYNARRVHKDLSDYPTLARIEKACLSLEAFQQAAPEKQPDAV
jgi:maleylpyruvate isomerase